MTLVLAAPLANAGRLGESFYGGRDEGWFFYKDPRELKEKEPPPIPVLPPPPEPETKEAKPEEKKEGPQLFSVKWLRENLDKLRDLAIDNPTPENVRAFYYAQRVMLDKADRFATVSQQVVLSDPLLDENNRFPIAKAAQDQVLRMEKQAKKDALKFLAEKTGIWFFFDTKCSYCAMQVGVVNHLAKELNFPVKAVSLDGQTLPNLEIPSVKDQGQFRALGLTMTPSLLLVSPPKTVMIISQGVLSDSAAESRILTVAASQNLLPEEITKQMNVASRGILTTEDTNNLDKSLKDNPADWVKYLQEKLKGRY